MGKYTYDSRPELSPDQKAYIKTSSECTIQTWIANELAEANRLKLFEIRLALTMAATSLSPKTIETLKKNLEDRA